ncbi:response regulator [Nannocystaceae bacterium ST9]
MPSPPHILIVEDELIVALELEHRLGRQGYAIAGTARSADEALAIANAVPVDLALLDLRLAGDRDGVELARDLSALDIPFVFLSAHGDDETLARVKAIEPQGYLLKPFDERLLRLTIETSLHRHRAERGRRAAVRAQRAAETMQATILEHSPDGVLVVSDEGSIVLSNRAAQQRFGLRGEHSTFAAIVPDLALHELKAECGTRSLRRVEARCSDGSSFPAELACGIAPLDEGDRLIVIVRDLSLRTQLEQQLVRARQLEVAGRVASGVAHDLNNLLSVVWMSAYMMQRSPASALPSLRHDLEHAINLGAALTTRLLSMARRGGSEPREVAVNEALRATVRLARRATNPEIELALELDPQAGSAWLDPVQLDQLVLNLALNADRAMPAGGRLTIRSRRHAIDPALVAIEVEDTGVGIDPAIREQVFEPFFSTRSDAGGTGLGLSIVKDIVEQIGGEIGFESELGRGTCFRILVRRHGGAEPIASAESKPLADLAGCGRLVLLVDDDDLHARSLARLFEAQGFRALHARGAGEAMLMVERGREPLAFAVIDMEMAYMDGRELSGRLKLLHRDLPIMLISGSKHILDDERRPADAFMRKPLEPQSLFSEVARLLGESEPAPC